MEQIARYCNITVAVLFWSNIDKNAATTISQIRYLTRLARLTTGQPFRLAHVRCICHDNLASPASPASPRDMITPHTRWLELLATQRHSLLLISSVLVQIVMTAVLPPVHSTTQQHILVMTMYAVASLARHCKQQLILRQSAIQQAGQGEQDFHLT